MLFIGAGVQMPVSQAQKHCVWDDGVTLPVLLCALPSSGPAVCEQLQHQRRHRDCRGRPRTTQA